MIGSRRYDKLLLPFCPCILETHRVSPVRLRIGVSFSVKVLVVPIMNQTSYPEASLFWLQARLTGGPSKTAPWYHMTI